MKGKLLLPREACLGVNPGKPLGAGKYTLKGGWDKGGAHFATMAMVVRGKLVKL